MLRMLEIVLRGDRVAPSVCVARELQIFLGDMVKPANQQDPKALGKFYNHYSVLRTIEDNFGLQPLTQNDRNASPITDIWK